MNKKEIDELLEHNIISSETARAITTYYEQKKRPTEGWLLAVFGIVGAALAGLGIILLFAHNWDNFTKTTRTLLAFLPLVIAQALAVYTYIKNKSRGWQETAATLLLFAVGACIALISQIYNIPGDIHTYTATLILLCLPLVYIFRSYALWILLLLCSTSYGGATTAGEHPPYLYFVFITLLLPFYFRMLKNNAQGNTAIVSGWLIPLSVVSCLYAFSPADSFLILIYMAMGCVFYTITLTPYFSQRRRAATGYRFFGIATQLPVLFIGTFNTSWQITALDARFENLWFVLAVVLSALILCFAVAVKKQTITLYAATAVLYPAIFALALASEVIAMVLCNILLLVIGIATVYKGIKTYNFGKLNFGLIVIALLTLCRFFDTDISFELRGILFLIVGLGFFAANYILIKKKQNKNISHEN
ncbi:DUF2157 domain-containing protein [Flavobacterium rhizosphaerae]|uniref:DUF2157 domain-containing protein n=1 Tax=Flavobacterium rhizosphaerae TaxID=3163298 RepID=A0ABW8YV12_9FLAO